MKVTLVLKELVEIIDELEIGDYDVSVIASDEIGSEGSDMNGITIESESTPTNDTDDVDDEIETAAPNDGDGNNDGTSDSQQSTVSSFLSADNETYQTIATNNEACTIANVTIKDESSFANSNQNSTPFPFRISYNVEDTDYDFPYGIAGFDINCAEAEITVIWHTVLPENMRVYRKFVPTTPGDESTSKWVTFPAVFSDIEVGGNPATKAVFTLRDGQLGDVTGVDGIIVDPGGVALTTLAEVTPTPNTTPTVTTSPAFSNTTTFRTGGTDSNKITMLIILTTIAILGVSISLFEPLSKKR